MKNTTCPYNEKVICAYLEQITTESITYNCEECPHYPNTSPVEEEENNDRIPLVAGAPVIGCLFLTIAIIIGAVYGLSQLIIWIRS